MAQPTGCTQNDDARRLVRQGTSQAERYPLPLDPAYAPVNERNKAHGVVFAQAYSAFLNYYNREDAIAGDWTPFFAKDVSAQLAAAVVQDLDGYKAEATRHFEFLNNRRNQSDENGLKEHLGCLFSLAGTVAKQLDSLKEKLPEEVSLKGDLQNLIKSRLAPAFRQLAAYYKADFELPAPQRLIAATDPNILILGARTVPFSQVYDDGLSDEWITDGATNWNAYTSSSIAADPSVYGTGATVFEKTNHIATHNLFSSNFDAFLKIYARIINDAKEALEVTFSNWNHHEPHYALFLAFLQLFEYARAETNTLTARHLNLYYQEILGLKPKPPEPSHAHLLVELARQSPTHQFQQGELFNAGKDDSKKEAFFANDRDVVVNQARVSALQTVYRHGEEQTGTETLTDENQGRIYASPISNSDDGMGAELTTTDQSWHPFYNKLYQDGQLAEIKMPKADLGFAIASHYLWMAEGTRKIGVEFTLSADSPGLMQDRKDDLVCQLTTEKGWTEKPASKFQSESGVLKLEIELSGEDPAITPYSTKIHGYTFAVDLPILLVKLRHQEASKYIYPQLQDVIITKIDLTADVDGLKSLAVSNDFGPVDTSKPFQPSDVERCRAG